MINDPKLVALADAMVREAGMQLSDGKGEFNDAPGPAFIQIEGQIDFEVLAATAMAALGIEFEWVEHDGSSEVPVDARCLGCDCEGTDGSTVENYGSKNIVWRNVKRWRPSLDNWR